MKINTLNSIIDNLSEKDIIQILSLLNQLTNVYNDDSELKEMVGDFKKNIFKFNSNIKIFIGSVDNKIIAMGTIIVEQKIIHGFGKVAHIEDIVVDSECRGKGIGKKLIEHLISKSKEYGCYKTILNCSEELVQFYSKCQPPNSRLKVNKTVYFYFD